MDAGRVGEDADGLEDGSERYWDERDERAIIAGLESPVNTLRVSVRLLIA